jgi:cytoskeletal protein CcmA (bactofilin family)
MKHIHISLLSLVLLFAPFVALAQEESSKIVDTADQDVFRMVAEAHPLEIGTRDFVAIAPVVDVNAPITKDLLAAGGTIIIQENIGGDVRVGGARVIIEPTFIGGNVAIVAQSVEIKPGANIAGTVKIRAQVVVMDGDILGDADIAAQEFTQNGTIAGTLTYHEVEINKPGSGGISLFFRLIGLFGMLVLGLVLVSLWPKIIRTTVAQSIKNPSKDFLWGLGTLILTPIVVVLLMLTIIGIPLGLILVAGYAIALYISKIMVGIILGTYIFGAVQGRDKANKSSLLAAMVIGILVLWLIGGIPVIGWIVSVIALVWGLGLLVNIKLRFFRKLESK